MKKLLSTMLALVCAMGTSFCFSSCKWAKLQMDKEYVYKKISFKKARGLTIEDISTFIPAQGLGYEINTVKDFENLLKDNIDTYSIDRLTENGRERIPLKPTILSIRVTEGYPYVANAYSFWLKCEGVEEEIRYGMVREGDVFTCPDSMAKMENFYFKNGALHYDLDFNEKFSVVYHYNC